MFVYVGKLNYHPYAKDEIISIIFNGDITTVDESVISINQWTKAADGKEKKNAFRSGTLTRVKQLRPGLKEIVFFDHDKAESYYW
ncbi:hypothetical protein N7501_002917 [Penicillium viridicatum]|nr:hypothetical protein N7501_002917 [Penicillium viridicatum]